MHNNSYSPAPRFYKLRHVFYYTDIEKIPVGKLLSLVSSTLFQKKWPGYEGRTHIQRTIVTITGTFLYPGINQEMIDTKLIYSNT